MNPKSLFRKQNCPICNKKLREININKTYVRNKRCKKCQLFISRYQPNGSYITSKRVGKYRIMWISEAPHNNVVCKYMEADQFTKQTELNYSLPLDITEDRLLKIITFS